MRWRASWSRALRRADRARVEAEHDQQRAGPRGTTGRVKQRRREHVEEHPVSSMMPSAQRVIRSPSSASVADRRRRTRRPRRASFATRSGRSGRSAHRDDVTSTSGKRIIIGAPLPRDGLPRDADDLADVRPLLGAIDEERGHRQEGDRLGLRRVSGRTLPSPASRCPSRGASSSRSGTILEGGAVRPPPSPRDRAVFLALRPA